MLERNREDFQRQLAAADTQLTVMEARLSDANTEIEGLQQRLTLEQGRWERQGRIIWGGNMILWSPYKPGIPCAEKL